MEVNILAVLLFSVCLYGRGMCQDGPLVNVSTSFTTQTTIALGEEVTMSVEIMLLPGTTTEIELDMVNMENNSAVAFFYGPTSTIATGLTYEVISTQRTFSPLYEEVYDSMYITAMLTTDETSNGTLELQFGVAVAKTLVSAPVLFAIGGSYNDTAIHVWSIQRSFQVSTTQPPSPSYNISISCQPADLEISYFSLCTATFTSSDRYSSLVSINITVSNKEQLLANTFSIGSIIEIERRGAHLVIPEDFDRTTSYSYNSDGFSSFATINLGLVVKPAGSGDLVVQFALSSHKDDVYAGQTLDLNASIIVFDTLAGSTVESVNIVERSSTAISLVPNMLDIKLIGDNGTTISSISSGSLFEYEINVDTRSLGSKFLMYLTTAPYPLGMSVCDIELISRDFNTPFVFPPTAYVDHVTGYDIYNTRQVTDPDTGIIKYRVLGQYFGNTGDSAQMDFKLQSGTTIPSTGTVTIDSPANPTKVFKSAQVVQSVNTLEPNRALGLKLVIELLEDSTYPDVEFLLIPDKKNQSHIPLRVCISSLGYVSVPCVKFQESLIQSRTKYFRSQNDSSYMDDISDSISVKVGTLSTLHTPGQMEFMFLVSMPWGDPDYETPPDGQTATGIEYNVGVTVENYFVWTENVKMNVSVNPLIRAPYNLSGGLIENPRLELQPANMTASVVENAPFLIIAEIKVGPGITQDIDLVVYPPNGTELCRLSLMKAGRYLGCVQGGDWYHGERYTWRNTSRLRYQVDPPFARLTLFGLTNVGSQSLNVTDNYHNSLLVNLPLFILPGFAGGDIKAQIFVANTNVTPLAENLYTINPGTVSTLAVPTSTNLTFSVTPPTYVVQRPNVMEVEVQVPMSTAHEMILSLTAPADAPLCATHVVFVGELMPCVNGSMATHTMLSGGTTAEVNLGKVCRIEQSLVDFPNTDVIRVLAAFLPALSASGPRQFTADVKYDGIKQNIDVQSAVINLGSAEVNGNETATFILTLSDANKTRIKENATFLVTVSIPLGAAIPVKLRLSTFPSVTRPSLTISNLTLVSVGRNLLCAEPLISEVLNALTTDSYFSSHGDPDEPDTVDVDFGVLSNTGFTELTYNDMVDDNQFNLSVVTTVNDAPWNDNDAYIGVLIEVTSGIDNVITYSNATTQVMHEDTDLPVMNLSLNVEYPSKIYSRMDEVQLIFSIEHMEETMAEPYEIELLMYLPFGNYLNFTRHEAMGIQPKEVYFPLDKTRLITRIGPIRFFDTSVVSYYFKVNPDNNRHFGFRNYDLTIPYTITTKLSQRFNIEGYVRFPDNDVGRLPPVIDHIRVSIESPTCSDDIHLSNSDIFPDCLFTASSVLNSNFPPHFARVTSTSPWVPRYSGDKEYLKVDLVNHHVISKILIKSHPDFLKVKSLIVEASIDGSVWEDYVNVTLPDVTGLTEFEFSRSLSGRYFRIYIASVYGTGKSVGLLFDFRGCSLSSDKNPHEVCQNTTLPATADADIRGRHFAVDTTLDVAAFCEHSIDLEANKCYISRDTGIVWSSLPYYIGILHGYHPVTQMLYASNFASDTYYFSNDGGIHWTPFKESEKNASENTTLWKTSEAIPYIPGSTQKLLGNWAADSSGILYGSGRVASWGSCCDYKI